MLMLFNHTLIDPLILNFCGLGSFDTLKLPPVIYSKVTCHDKDKSILMKGTRRSLHMVGFKDTGMPRGRPEGPQQLQV